MLNPLLLRYLAIAATNNCLNAVGQIFEKMLVAAHPVVAPARHGSGRATMKTEAVAFAKAQPTTDVAMQITSKMDHFVACPQVYSVSQTILWIELLFQTNALANIATAVRASGEVSVESTDVGMARNAAATHASVQMKEKLEVDAFPKNADAIKAAGHGTDLVFSGAMDPQAERPVSVMTLITGTSPLHAEINTAQANDAAGQVASRVIVSGAPILIEYGNEERWREPVQEGTNLYIRSVYEYDVASGDIYIGTKGV